MASQPLRIIWTDESAVAFKKLPFGTRRQIATKLEMVQQHPRMYQAQESGRWRGLRRILVENWKVYYVYWDTTHTIYIEAVCHGRADDPE